MLIQIEGHPVYDTVVTGSTTTDGALADTPCRLVRFSTPSTNTGDASIGSFKIAKGADTGWIPVHNLNVFSVTVNAVGSITWMILK